MVYEIEKTIDVAELFDELSDNEQKDFLVEKINDNFCDEELHDFAFECINNLVEWRQIDIIKNVINNLSYGGRDEVLGYLNEK